MKTKPPCCKFETAASSNWRRSWPLFAAAPRRRPFSSALENEFARIEGEKSLAERLKPLQERIAAVPRTGLEADKDFYDDLSGDP